MAWFVHVFVDCECVFYVNEKDKRLYPPTHAHQLRQRQLLIEKYWMFNLIQFIFDITILLLSLDECGRVCVEC